MVSNGKKGQGGIHKGLAEVAQAVLVGKHLVCKVSLNSQGPTEGKMSQPYSQHIVTSSKRKKKLFYWINSIVFGEKEHIP